MANEKLTAFARQVGLDYKALLAKITQLETAIQNSSDPNLSLQQVDEKIQALKTELLGDNPSQALDTFKEIADKINKIEGSVENSIIEKIKEFRTALTSVQTKQTELETTLTELQNLDLVAIYTTAKNGA